MSEKIEGLLFEVTSDELRKVFLTRVEFYKQQKAFQEKRLSLLQQQLAAAEGVEAEPTPSYANTRVRTPKEATMDQLTGVEESVKHSEARIKSLTWCAEHVINDVVYRLRNEDLVELGIIPAR